MLKNLLVLVLFSLAVVFGSQHIQPIIMVLVSWHNWISQLLLQVFAGGEIGSAIRSLISLLVIPLIFGIIPTIIYWIARNRLFPYFMHVAWVVWLLQTTALIVLRYHT